MVHQPVVARYPGSSVAIGDIGPITNNLSTTLSASINDSTTIPVASTAGWQVNMLGLMTDAGTFELVWVTAVGASTLTVIRGADGTTRSSHLLGATLAATTAALTLNQLAAEVVALEGDPVRRPVSNSFGGYFRLSENHFILPANPSNLGQALRAAIADLPSAGGTVDASAAAGTFVIGPPDDPFLYKTTSQGNNLYYAKNVRLIFGPCTIELTRRPGTDPGPTQSPSSPTRARVPARRPSRSRSLSPRSRPA